MTLLNSLRLLLIFTLGFMGGQILGFNEVVFVSSFVQLMASGQWFYQGERYNDLCQ